MEAYKQKCQKQTIRKSKVKYTILHFFYNDFLVNSVQIVGNYSCRQWNNTYTPHKYTNFVFASHLQFQNKSPVMFLNLFFLILEYSDFVFCYSIINNAFLGYPQWYE